jgi:hypothetical protein
MKTWKDISSDDKIGILSGLLTIILSVYMMLVSDKERKNTVPLVVTTIMIFVYGISSKIDTLIRDIKKD